MKVSHMRLICYLRFTFGETPADLLMASMVIRRLCVMSLAVVLLMSSRPHSKVNFFTMVKIRNGSFNTFFRSM